MKKTTYEKERDKKNKAIDSTLARLGLTMEWVFIPFSQSRNKAEKDFSLNWRVTIKRNGQEILTTDYGAGCGHCPSYKNPIRFSSGRKDEYRTREAIQIECESGRPAKHFDNFSVATNGQPTIGPDTRDVLYSLITDSDALDYATFEEWAACFGFDPDSRKGEKVYQECLKLALQMRTGIGEKGLSSLRKVFQDY